MANLLPAERPALAVDTALFSILDGQLQCLLIRRGTPPFVGAYALPGGFVLPNESLEEAAFRELQEESNVRNVYLEQLYTFGDPERDPRGRVVSVAYYALIDAARQTLRASTDAAEARWFPVSRLPALAFDHARIVKLALDRLRGRANYTTVAFQLMPRAFTIEELHRVYSIIMGRPLDRRNFRKKIVSLGILVDTGKVTAGRRSRPGRLYKLKSPAVERLQERGVVMPY